MRRERKHALENALAAGVEAAVRIWPRSIALGLGARFGAAMGRLARRHVGIAQGQLAQAFTDWDEDRRLAVARGVYVHLGRILFDLLWWRSRDPNGLLDVVDFEGVEHAEQAEASGRGVIYVTGHIGSWEINGVAHALRVAPMGVVARPLDNPRLDARLTRFRQCSGNPVISKRNALPDILRLIKSGKGVAFLVDQNTQEKDGIFVEFFGRPACTTPVAGTLAHRTGAMIVAGHAVLGADGRYRQSYDPPTEWQPSGDRQRDVREITQRLSDQIEAWVRRDPEQWLWIHRRWHTQPSDAWTGRPR